MVQDQAMVVAVALQNIAEQLAQIAKTVIRNQSMIINKSYVQVSKEKLFFPFFLMSIPIDIDECQANLFISPCGFHKCNNTEGGYECYGKLCLFSCFSS